MKKMFYTLALIVSSFFFFNIEVKADFNLSFNSSYLNDLDTLKSIVDNKYPSSDYIITRQGTSYMLYIIPSSTSVLYQCGSYKRLKFGSAVNKYYIVINGNVIADGTSSQVSLHTNSDNVILYSTLDIPTSYSLTFNFTLDDFTTSFTCDGSPLPTESDVYNLSLGSSNSHDSELSIIQSFYEVSISKISYLAEFISSNYIYLSIFGVFILIFVFELIFRRYL